MTFQHRRALALATATLAAATLTTATTAPPAQANYTQYTCKLPDGSPAGTDGWVPDEADPRFHQDVLCDVRAGVRTRMDTQDSQPASAGGGPGPPQLGRLWTRSM